MQSPSGFVFVVVVGLDRQLVLGLAAAAAACVRLGSSR